MQEQTVDDKTVLPAPDSTIAKRRRAWRETKDKVAKYGVGFGGISVILAIVLIFFYLLYVVLPLFQGASLETRTIYQTEQTGSQFLTLNEYNDVALSVNDNGTARFFEAENGATMLNVDLPVNAESITATAAGAAVTGVFAYGMADGSALVFNQEYKITYPTGTQRKIIPRIEYPLGEALVQVDPQGQPLELLSVQSYDDKTTFGAVTADQRVVLKSVIRESSFLDPTEFTLKEKSAEINLTGSPRITHLQLDIEQ
ncbi:MAG: phosphate ABC transporter permease, partial [Pseudomonadota bacterium]|nr:phosphate ABC transporter permease [Pseudomonadota bacterium]